MCVFSGKGSKGIAYWHAGVAACYGYTNALASRRIPHQILPNKVKNNPSRLCSVCKAHGKKSNNRRECERCEVALSELFAHANHTERVDAVRHCEQNKASSVLYDVSCALYTTPCRRVPGNRNGHAQRRSYGVKQPARASCLPFSACGCCYP